MPHGLTLSQFTVLNHFVRLGNIESPARLARSFQVTKGAMTNTLGKLEKQGFIHINPDPNDGRAKLVDITESGKNAQSDCIQALAPMLIRLTNDIGLEGMNETLPQLELIRKYLDAARE